jgi:hypothetical protein
MDLGRSIPTVLISFMDGAPLMMCTTIIIMAHGKPGPLVMLNGLVEFQAVKRGIALLTPQPDV